MIIPKGTFLGPYEVLAAIESGGMSSVYRARDPRLGRQVAIKVLPAAAMLDDSLVKRFQREARAAAALQHPNIVAVYDVGEAEVTATTPYGAERTRVRYMVEELVEGSSLRSLIHEAPLHLLVYLDIAIGIARGLEAAHGKGLVHRDLKPDNVLIDASGRPKITDFGLVHWLEMSGTFAAPGGAHDSLTKSGYVVGTLGYMSPEQARGDTLDGASDLFVYGVLLYELLTGQSPFARTDPDEAFRAVMKGSAPSLAKRAPDAPPELVRIIERCLEKSRSARYSSASQLVRDLERLRSSLEPGGAGAARPAVPSGTRARRGEQRTARLSLLAALAVVLAFAGGWAIGRIGPRGGAAFSAAPPPRELEFREWRTEFCAAAARDSDPIEAALTPDGEDVVFTTASGEETDVFAAAARGGAAPRRLSREAGGRAPFIASEGRVLFSSGRADATSGIWDAPLSGAEDPKQLVPYGQEPALSPDETHLAFVKRGPGGSELWVSRRDGLLPRRILSSGAADWRYPVFTSTGNALLIYVVKTGAVPGAGSAQLAFVSLGEPQVIPYENARQLDPSGRALPLPGGRTFLRSFRERAAFVLEPHGRAMRRLPFGADLAVLTGLRDGRTALTRAEGGPLVLWRRL